MRFAGPDVVLFIAGALLFSGSVYGLIQLDGHEGSATGAFKIAWSEATEEVPVGSFDTEPAFPYAFTVNGTGVGNVLVTVICSQSPAAAGPVTTSVSVDLAGPNGQGGQQSGTCDGQAITIEIPTGNVTEGATVQAGTASEAEAAALADFVGTSAVGAWSGNVTFTQQGNGLPVPQVVTWSGDVTATLTRFAPRATAISAR